ncbi:PAS domain S-box protein [Salibacterium salarium]|uniref:histidine kinase n=1 Tax=Salibacterium salarium TaxID=284579 RepID=A0A428N5Z2_9BACI|nr:transporter substrate-binding domain-containing protein [Salibacterium salarium]RSL33905.1 PAS domain S-box protein [Salibacterium salarium]
MRIYIIIMLGSMVYLWGIFGIQKVEAEKERDLIVAYEPERPPFHYQEDGEPAGFAVEILEEIEAREPIQVTYIPMSEREAVSALKTGEVEVVMGLSYSEQRAETMEFSNPYYSSSAGLFVPDKSADIGSVADLSNHTVAVKTDSVERDFLQNIRSIQFNETSSLDQAVQLMIRGRADALTGEVTSTRELLEQYGQADRFTVVDNYLAPIEFSFATSSEDYQSLRQLNNGMQDIHNDGTYQELFQKWFPEEDESRQNTWFAVQIVGAAIIVTAAVTFIVVRINRRLQQEIARQTERLNETNFSLQKQIEATKNSNEFQKQILQSSPRGMITIGRDGTITSFNPKATFMLNTEESVVGNIYQDEELLYYFLKDKWERVLHLGEQFLGEESIWTRTDGIRLRLRTYIYPLYNFEQDIVGVMFTFEDISEEIQVRYQAFENEKNQALSRVVAGIAHEIRNPLTSIKTFTDLIPAKFHSESFRAKVSTLVPQEMERINQLIEGLMDYSKSRPVQQEVLDTSVLLESCQLLFERTAANKSVTIDAMLEQDLWILADRQQLKQAVINLVINGVDALADRPSETEKQVVLRNYRQNGNIYMDIQDNGPGMTEEVQRQVFEPFYTTKTDGTGLGLAIAKQHVEENQGAFEVWSKPDKGTRIHLIFPEYQAMKERIDTG